MDIIVIAASRGIRSALTDRIEPTVRILRCSLSSYQ